MSEKYHKLPSEILGIECGTYLSYCVDEVAIFIINQMKLAQKEKRVFKYKKQTVYKSFSELYKKYSK